MRTLIASILLPASLLAAATPLTPDQALEAAMGSIPHRAKAVNAMTHTGTLSDDAGVPTVYLYTSPTEGFLILAADDAVGQVVLGYSDSATLPDDGSIPANVAWWLDMYSHEVSYAAASGTGASVEPKVRAAIAPLVTSKWNQSAPYNNDCPVLEGRRAVTGCVATAMAQVMYRHRWPQKGTGEHTYTYNYNGTDYTESFNFGATTFRWDRMIDSYGGTTLQRAAVAELMHACGVVSEMMYGPSGSGAWGGCLSGRGMIDFLGYDAAMLVLEREWFSAGEWEDIVYSELEAGRPLYYQGDDTRVGHAFVCDGYSSNGFFHFNWGWGGYYDGYFRLTSLNPQGRGIGGGTLEGSKGYIYNQGILANCMPRREGVEQVITPAIACEGMLATSASVYPIDSETKIYMECHSDNWSYQCHTCGSMDYILGLRACLPEGDIFIPGDIIPDLMPLDRIWNYSVPTTLPQGSYYAYPAFMVEGSDSIYDMKVWVRKSPTCLRFDVTAESVTVSPGLYYDGITARFGSLTPDYERDEGFYPGHSYRVSFYINSLNIKEVTAKAVVTDADGDIIIDTDCQTVALSGNESDKIVRFPITIPDDMPLGNYYLTLCDEEGAPIGESKVIEVTEAPFQVRSELIGIVGSEENTLMRGTETRCVIALDINRPWTEQVECRLMKKSGTRYSTAVIGEKKEYSLPEGRHLDTWSIDIPDDLALGRYYLALVYSNGEYIALVDYPAAVNVVEFSGIDGLSIDPSSTTLYDLTGRPIDHPLPGHIYITGTRKVIIK